MSVERSFKHQLQRLLEVVEGTEPGLAFADLEAYRSGVLSAEDEERVRAHLVRSPESVERLLWLIETSGEVPLGDAEATGLEDPEVWRELRSKLPAMPASKPWRNVMALAASLLLALVAAGWWWGFEQHRKILRLEQRLHSATSGGDATASAIIDVETPVLSPPRRTRGATEDPVEIQIPPDTGLFVLVLDVAAHTARFSEFEVEVIDLDGRSLTTSRPVIASPHDHLTLILDRRSLPASTLLRIQGLSPSGRFPLETWRFR